VIVAFAYGLGASQYGLFPVPLISAASDAAEDLLERSGMRLSWYFHRTTETVAVRAHAADALAPGLRLISGMTEDRRYLVRVMDIEGRVIHSWPIDWFKIWPEPKHLTDDLLPAANAGPVHGLAVASNGDLIFNFEELGMVRLDACGEVIWRLPYRTHHSLYLDESGNVWAPGLITREERRPNLPNYDPPFSDYTIVKVSPEGKILQELSIADLLIENDLRGLLYMTGTRNRSTRATGDTLHLNDVETFPSSMPPGVFRPGDVMISLRNINAMLVFDGSSRRVKFLSVGAVIRQHDPDFVDGNTISVFDNNNLAHAGRGKNPDAAGHHSRIVRISASTNAVEVGFSGTNEKPFFTDIMGDHQLLSNGNTLLTESVAGRVVEVNASGDIVWEYFNLVGNGLIALISDAQVLPSHYDEGFFARALSKCSTASRN
jgi:hypothetical protein